MSDANTSPTELLNLLYTQVSSLTEQVKSLQLQQASQPPVSRCPEPKIPVPERYSGNRKDIKNFLSTVKTVFRLQASRFPTDAIKISYIGTLLTNDAKTWYRSLEECESNSLLSLNDFLAVFENTFGDPNAAWNARVQLARCRQEGTSCLTFTTKFKALALESGYDQTALLQLYHNGLNDDIKDVLAHTDRVPDSFEEYSSLCIRIDNRQFQRKLEKKSQGRNNSRNPRTFGHNPSIPTYNPNPEATSMQVDVIDLRPKSQLPEDEKQRRRREGLCLYCAEPGHQAFNCPNKRANHQHQPKKDSVRRQ